MSTAQPAPSVAGRVMAIVRGPRYTAYLEAGAVTRSSRFVEDLAFGSLVSVEFAMDLEEEFGLGIPDEDAQRWETVGDAIAWLERSVEGDAPAPRAS